MPLLETRGLTISFGGLVAVDRVDFAMEAGEIVGLIGPNGSGKTTFFNLVTGIYAPTAGRFSIQGEDFTGLEPHQIARRGIARTFQQSRLFGELSVLDNLLIGAHLRQTAGFAAALLARGRLLAEVRREAEEALGLVALFNPELPARAFDLIRDLPQIDRRRVEICRALMAAPRLLLLDEPSAGMSPEETLELMTDLEKIRSEHPGLSVIVIEHDMAVIEGISGRVVAFNYGRKIAEGSFAEVARNEEVREAYLGKEATGA